MIGDNMCHISPSTLFGSFHDGLVLSRARLKLATSSSGTAW